jgi:hypothetical protein
VEVCRKRLLSLIIFIGFVFISIAVAAENDSSGFVGSWGGVFTSNSSRERNAIDMKIDIGPDGKIFLSSFKSNGNVVSPPPKVVAQEPGLLTLKTKLVGRSISHWRLRI